MQFDVEYVRRCLEDSGIVNGEVVNPEALHNNPFVRQVTELATQIQNDQEDDDPVDFDDEPYTPSSTYGDYSPGNPWDAPGMSIHDFI